jgi:group I intron endonuclease
MENKNYNSGIYQIINKVNGKKYIGSSKDLIKREKDHFRLLRKNTHHGGLLQYAYNKYGENNFVFEIILFCEIIDLLYYEQKFLDMYPKSVLYNTCRIAGSTLGIKHSEKANKAKSERQKRYRLSEQSIEKIKKTMTGVKHTIERRKNESIAHKGKMMGEQHSGIKPVLQIDKNTNEVIQFFICIQNAADAVGAFGCNISGCCKRKYGRKTVKGFIWHYATAEEILLYKNSTLFQNKNKVELYY